MKSEEYLDKHTDRYAMFYEEIVDDAGNNTSNSYTAPGIEVEHARKYAELVKKEFAEAVIKKLQSLAEDDTLSKYGLKDAIDEIKKQLKQSKS
jgi:hypothetical protein